MIHPRLATYSIDGSTRYGAVVDGGIVDLSARFAKEYPTLGEVIAADALPKLAEDAIGRIMRWTPSPGCRRSPHRKRSSALA